VRQLTDAFQVLYVHATVKGEGSTEGADERERGGEKENGAFN
jgi:hypothetical protein